RPAAVPLYPGRRRQPGHGLRRGSDGAVPVPPRGRAEDHRRFAGSDRGGRRKPGHLAPAADRGGAGDGHGPGRPDRAPSSGYPAGGAGAPVRESGGLCPEVAVHPGGEGRADLSLRRRTCVSGPGAGAGFPGLPPRGVRRPAGVRGPGAVPQSREDPLRGLRPAVRTGDGDAGGLCGGDDPGPSGGLRGADSGAAQRRQIPGLHWLQEEAGPVPGAAAGGGVHRRGVRPPSR
ncbi:glycerol-3-phosphate 1-O-acyltransferase PlsY, partial [Dysosmobacter welbionis]